MEQQADIIGLLLHHIHAPLVDAERIRGVLPVAAPAEAIRVVVGARRADRLTAYEIPLREDDGLRSGYDVIALLRAVLSTPRSLDAGVGAVMGMPLVRVDPAVVEPAEDTPDDLALRVVRTLVRPFTEDRPKPLLLGFLLLGSDRLRLYLESPKAGPGTTAVDLSLSGALTALLTALPSLIDEQYRTRPTDDDPHCARVVDLADW
ncbi:hypothetical protein AB0G15_33810 [Streptosporangium sp. NPDC023825]|uniref:hypothetical protein n=1 Tax=Streptosporangium sp. NPDC023825 TaxID=3154909 RepID=UPI0034336EDD